MSAVRPCHVTLHNHLLSVKLHPKGSVRPCHLVPHVNVVVKILCNICIDYTATPVALFSSVCKITTVLCDTTDIIYNMILSPHYHYVHERVQCALGTERPCCLTSSIYGCHTIRYMCKLSPEKWHAKLYDETTVKILVWYSRSVHLEKWHALYDVNACENHYPGKWQAMHDANACENTIGIILRRQSPCFKCM